MGAGAPPMPHLTGKKLIKDLNEIISYKTTQEITITLALHPRTGPLQHLRNIVVSQ